MTAADEKPTGASGSAYSVFKREALKRVTSDESEDFARSADVEAWTFVLNVTAHSAHNAIRKAVGENPGTYVAIPSRSFAPATVKVETQTKITLG